MMFMSLYFDAGPFQSWGYGSYFDQRQTKTFPLKSSVTGIICRSSNNFINNIGKEKFVEFLKKVNSGKFYSILLYKANIKKDYQIARIGCENEVLFKAGSAFKKGGKHKDPVVMSKYYLEDAVTASILSYEDENFLRKIAEFIKKPLHPIGIGRMNCPPVSPIFNSLDDNFNDSFLSLIDRFNKCSKKNSHKSNIYGEKDFIRIDDNYIIKLVSPSTKGNPINDVMVGEKEYISRLVIKEDFTLKEWKKKLKILN